MDSTGYKPTASHSLMNAANDEIFLLEAIDAGDVAEHDPHCCPNCAVVILSGAMAEPLYSYMELESSKLVIGLSCKLSKSPSAAKGSIGSIAAEAVVERSASEAAGDGTPMSASSELAVSTMGGGAATTGVGANVVDPNMSVAIAAAGTGVGVASKAPMSSKSISGAGGGAVTGGATTGGAATGGATAGAGLGGGGAGAGGGIDPGTMPPNKAAACRSFSNCSGVFWARGAGADAPYPPLLPNALLPPYPLLVLVLAPKPPYGLEGASGGAGAADGSGAAVFLPHTLAAPRVFRVRPSSPPAAVVVAVEVTDAFPRFPPGGGVTTLPLELTPPLPMPRIMCDRLTLVSGLA